MNAMLLLYPFFIYRERYKRGCCEKDSKEIVTKHSKKTWWFGDRGECRNKKGCHVFLFNTYGQYICERQPSRFSWECHRKLGISCTGGSKANLSDWEREQEADGAPSCDTTRASDCRLLEWTLSKEVAGTTFCSRSKKVVASFYGINLQFTKVELSPPALHFHS